MSFIIRLTVTFFVAVVDTPVPDWAHSPDVMVAVRPTAPAAGLIVIEMPIPVEWLTLEPSTQAPTVTGDVALAHPEKLSTTSAEAALPFSVPATRCVPPGINETAFSLAREAVRRPVNSGTGLETND